MTGDPVAIALIVTACLFLVITGANDGGALLAASVKMTSLLADVLEGDVTTGMLRRRELLRRLDVVGLRFGEAVDALADAAVKRTSDEGMR